jgi:AcrR family transcriptional regulator
MQASMDQLPTTPAEPRQRDAERSRAAILDAAERLFAELGVESASLQAIGEAAGVSRGLPSYLFGTKEQLYRATLARLIEAEHGALAEIEPLLATDASSEAVLTAAIRSHLAFSVSRPAFLKLLAREALRGGADLWASGPAMGVLAAGRALIAREQARGGITTGDSGYLLMNILALCWFPFTHSETIAKQLGFNPNDPGFVELHTAAIVRLLFDGLHLR